MVRTTKINFILGTLILLFTSACAGPSTPFGAINTNEKPTLSEFSNQHTNPGSGHTIQFSPSRQVLHSQSDLDIKINSADIIQDQHILKIYYNNRDVTKSYLKHASMTVLKDSKQIELEFKNLRLPPNKFHQITLAFQPSTDSSIVMADFLPPTCTESESSEIRSTVGFNPPHNYLQWIIENAKRSGYNPNYLAAVIAQESGFNEKSVSWSKAIGLTQITSSADKELQSLSPDWPRSSRIQNMSAVRLKTLVQSGKITGQNDWRLDPKESIEGGTLYISYLTKYWSRPENVELIRANFSDFDLGLSTVVIASYNSGATRIKRAMLEDGKNWLHNEDLGEARRYVNSVMSYCYFFSKKEL